MSDKLAEKRLRKRMTYLTNKWYEHQAEVTKLEEAFLECVQKLNKLVGEKNEKGNTGKGTSEQAEQ